MKYIATVLIAAIAGLTLGAGHATASRYLLPKDSVTSKTIAPEAIKGKDIDSEAVKWRHLSWQLQSRFDNWTIRYNGQEIECHAVYNERWQFVAMECA